MKTTDANLEVLSNKWMTKIVAMSSILNGEIHEGIRLGTNLDTRQVRGLTYGIIVSFGSYVIQQKILSGIGFDRKEEFANLMREEFLSIQKVITSGDHDEKWLAATKDMYDGPFRKMSSTKGPVTNYLKQALTAIFAQYTDLEFVENSFFNRLKVSSKHRVSMKILDDLVLSIWTGFMDLEIEAGENI